MLSDAHGNSRDLALRPHQAVCVANNPQFQTRMGHPLTGAIFWSLLHPIVKPQASVMELEKVGWLVVS